MAKLFTLPEHVKGNVLCGHVFDENRQILVHATEDAEKMESVLVRFYGVTVEDVAPAPADETGDTETNPSLDKGNTQGGKPSDEEE